MRTFNHSGDSDHSDTTRIHEAALKILAQTDHHVALQVLLEFACSQLRCSVASLRLYATSGVHANKLVHKACVGYGDDWIRQTLTIDIDNDDSITVRCFRQSPEPIFTIDNVQDNSVQKVFAGWTRELNLGSGIYMRLGFDDAPAFGTAALFRKAIDPFSEGDLQCARLLVPWLALGLHSVSSSDTTKQNQRERKVIRRALEQLARSLKETDDEQTFLKKTVDLIRILLHVHVATAFLYDENQRTLKRRAIASNIPGLDDDWFAEEHYPPGVGITGSVFVENKPSRGLHLDAHPNIHTPSLDRYQRMLHEHGGPVSQLIVPIHGQSGRSIGVLRALNKLGNESDKPTPQGFTDEDEHLLDFIGSAIGITVDSLRLLSRTKSKVDFFERTQETVEQLAHLRLGTDDLLNRLALTHRFPDADYMDVVLTEPDLGSSFMKLKTSVSGIPGIPPLHLRARPLSEGGITRQAMASKQIIVVDDVDTVRNDEKHSPYIVSMGIKSYAVIPLMLGDEAGSSLGALVVYSLKRNQFEYAEAHQRLKQYARIVAEAVHKSRSHDHEVMKLSTARVTSSEIRPSNSAETHLDALRQQIDLIETRVADPVRRNLQLSSVFVDYLARCFEVEDCSLYLPNETQSDLIWVASHRVSLGNLEPKTMPLSTDSMLRCGLTVHTALTKQSLRFSDNEFTQHSAWNGGAGDHLAHLRVSSCHALMVVPITNARGKLMGVIKLENRLNPRAHEPFTSDDEKLVQKLGYIGVNALQPIRREIALKEGYEEGVKLERTRFKDELHQELQVFTKVVLQVESLSDLIRGGKLDEALTLSNECTHTLKRASDDLRLLAIGSGDLVLPREGLYAAILGYTHQIIHRRGYEFISVRGAVSDMPSNRPSPIVEAALWSIFRNALGNALKHSGVAEKPEGWIWVTLSIFPNAEPDLISLRIEDNGNGFDSNALQHTDGLRQMNEKATSIRAKCTIESSPGIGTIVEVIYRDTTRNL